MIPCEIDLTSTPFSDTTIITYGIELASSGKKIGFNLLDDEDFTIQYITDEIPDSPADHQLTPYTKRNLCIIAINGEETITDQGIINELNIYQNPREKSNIKISICIRKSTLISPQ